MLMIWRSRQGSGLGQDEKEIWSLAFCVLGSDGYWKALGSTSGDALGLLPTACIIGFVDRFST